MTDELPMLALRICTELAVATSSNKDITDFVWLPLAASSPLLFLNIMVVNARVLPTRLCHVSNRLRSRVLGRYSLFSQTAVALILSPIFPPLLRYVTRQGILVQPLAVSTEGVRLPFKSVETPVA